MPSFNLLSEPWIASLSPEGDVKERSLRETLLNAHQLSEITDESPLVVAALHRLLIAILHRVFGPADSEAWGRLWKAGAFPKVPLETYFQEWNNRFDLFDPFLPFYQTTEIEEADDPRPVNKLEFQIASANNATLFDHTTDSGDFTLPPSRAARALVTNQCFALAGLAGYLKRTETDADKGATDAPSARGAICLLMGSSLFETLLLNLCRYASAPDTDRPTWELSQGKTRTERMPSGRLDLLTWQSRRARLFPSPDGSVDRVKLVAGHAVPADWKPFQQETFQAFVLKPDAKPDERPWYALRISPERLPWRDSQTLLFSASGKNRRPESVEWIAHLVEENELNEDFAYRVEILGAATDQQKIELWVRERLSVSAGLLRDDQCREQLNIVLEFARTTGETLKQAVRRLAEETLSPQLADKPKSKPDAKRCQDLAKSFAVEPQFWAALHLPFLRLLRDLGAFNLPDADERRAVRERVVSTWKEDARKSALAAFDTTAALLGTNPRLTRAHAIASLALRRGLAKYPKPPGKGKNK